METENKHPNIKMIHGTSGKQNYAAFARKGNFALAIKPNMIEPGNHMGGGETTVYFGARLRSCYATELGDDPNGVENVGTNFNTAWPNVTFEKMGSDRASTQVGTFIRGNLENDPQAIVAKFQNNEFMLSMSDYLISLAGLEYALVTREELADFLSSIYKDQIDKIMAYIEQKKEMQIIKDKMAEHSEANLGVFGIQAEQIKQMKASAGIKDKDDDIKNADGETDEPEDDFDNADGDAADYKGADDHDYD